MNIKKQGYFLKFYLYLLYRLLLCQKKHFLYLTTSPSVFPAKLIQSLTASVMHLVTLNTTNNLHGAFT